MNTKLIFQLSLFGLAMAAGTISLIPGTVEPVLWAAILIICALIIARNCDGKYFLHGFLVSLVNSVWITAAHIIFAGTYLAHHLQQTSVKVIVPFMDHPRLMMLIGGPIIGAISGVVLGLFAVIASKIVKKKPALEASAGK